MINKQNNKMTKKELVKFLVDNFQDGAGYVNLSYLDFTNENIKGVDISRMKVKGSVFQNLHKIEGNLYQNGQDVEGLLRQNNQEVKGDLFQDGQKVERDLYQNGQEIKGNLFKD
jgi:hypothetical protein